MTGAGYGFVPFLEFSDSVFNVDATCRTVNKLELAARGDFTAEKDVVRRQLFFPNGKTRHVFLRIGCQQTDVSHILK